ncbi:hypothetical protein CASFOL_014404 [Castilleja foliolosa]|uniref:Uncharacterized protein n=1 Tax=Castilleja foliolosa TaxID=1961234 RepID=A0ABD3DNY4_9LAMI
MPKGSKKRKAAKKKQPNNQSSASTHSADVKQHGGLIIKSTDDGLKINSSVDRNFEFGANKSNGTNRGADHGDEATKSYNGRSSSNSSSGNSSDDEDHSRATEPLILEENDKKSSSEAIVQSVEKKTAESAFVDNGVEQEKESVITEVYTFAGSFSISGEKNIMEKLLWAV